MFANCVSVWAPTIRQMPCDFARTVACSVAGLPAVHANPDAVFRITRQTWNPCRVRARSDLFVRAQRSDRYNTGV